MSLGPSCEMACTWPLRSAVKANGVSSYAAQRGRGVLLAQLDFVGRALAHADTQAGELLGRG